jgi:chloramphenicol O-acetyltransferase type B
MGFGLLKIFKFLSVNYTINQLKRLLYLFHYKNKGLKIGLHCSINSSKIGKNVYIGDNVTFYNSEIGNNSYINKDSQIRDTKIGKFCSIGPGVKIVLGNHPTDLISTHPTFYSNNKPFKTISKQMYYDEYKGVIIGNDVWIGEDVLIPGGIKIGDGAIITSRAVITKDVAPYSIVGGIPAKLIKYRFNDEEIMYLIKFKWWDKNDEWLINNHELFLNPKLFFEKKPNNF